MGSMVGERKPHAVCIPCPAQGHINSMMKLAMLLHSNGFHVTFVNNEFNYERIVKAGNGPTSPGSLDDFRYETIPDGLPPSSDLDTSQDVTALCTAIREGKLTGPFRELVKRLNGSSSDVPPVTCIISDTYVNFSAGVARELGIPVISFCSTGALGFMGSYSYKELLERGIVPLKCENDLVNGYLDTEIIDWIPGMPNMRLRDLPSFVRTTDPNDVLFNYVKDETQESLKAKAIVVNSFEDLEGPVLDAMSSLFGSVYSIGPLNLLCSQTSEDKSVSIRSSFWKEDSACLEWLEGKEPKSVIYVNFGSIATMTGQQLVEFAWGLANSGHDFLWIIRPDALIDKSAVLPNEFLDATRGRGLLARWCSQEDVLRHPSVGGFLTHCGWNSTIEAISAGVPMMCWPFFGDQQTNCRYMCDEWGIGMEVDNDVKRETVEEMIRELLGGKQKGMEMRRRASQWKESAARAALLDGKSFLDFQRLLKDISSVMGFSLSKLM